MGILLLIALGALPEVRAVNYLAREVPQWAADNKCHSCHNNGDGARALIAARRLAFPLPPRALDDTTRWLARPGHWLAAREERQADADKELTHIQFGGALADALDAGLLTDPAPLREAAQRLAALQRPDGTWPVDTATLVGTPTTYGPALAASQARRVLLAADPKRYAAAVAAMERWFRKAPVNTVLDAAILARALEGAADAAAVAQQKRCWEIIRQGEAKGGGWGPYTNSAPEPFDTAVVLLALAGRPAEGERIRRGRAYLIGLQSEDGGWPTTTRPAGGDSYAQRVSTSAWATLALLATRRWASAPGTAP